METLLPKSPSTYWHLLRMSFKLYRASFNKVLILAFLLALTSFVPRLLSYVIEQDIFANLPPLSPERLWMFVCDVIATLFFVGIIWRMYCIARRVNEPFIEDIIVGAKKALSVCIATFIQFAIVFGIFIIIFGLQLLLVQMQLLTHDNLWGLILAALLFIAQFLLIIYIFTLFVFIIPLIAIENESIFGALERSILLAWHHWWRVFSLQVTPWLCYLTVLLLIKYVLHINVHLYLMEQDHHSIGATIIQMGIFTCFAPWLAALLLIQLKDLELRRNKNITNEKNKEHMIIKKLA